MRLSHYLGIADHSVEPDPPIPGSRFRTAAADFARLQSRICSVVNSPPQTLQRQPGDAARAINGAEGWSARLALTSSLLHSGHCR